MSSIRLLWPAALGALGVFGFAPYGHFWLPVLALALFFAALARSGPKPAFGYGLAFGLGHFLAGVSWVYVSLHTFGQLPAPLAVLATGLFCLVLALFPALAAAGAARLAPDPAWRLALALPAAWVLGEWLRGWVLTGFPWLTLGYAQAPANGFTSPLAGFAPLAGVYGVSLLAALTAGALAWAWVARHGWPLLAVAAAWLGGWGLQAVPWTKPAGPPLAVSLVQGNVAQSLKFEPGHLRATLLDYLQLARAARGRLVILPETALPLLWHDVPADYRAALAATVRARDGDLLAGVADGNTRGDYYNAVVSLGSAPEQRYYKTHLVPFGEFVPPGFAWIVRRMHIPLGDFSRGAPDQPPLAVAGQRVALNICYEDAFGEERLAVLPAATLMANVSNDAWFGASASPWQHLQMAQMRALETGRPWLRANNTGITAAIDARGHVVAQLPPFTRGVLETEARGHTGLTPYARRGNAPAVTLALLLLGLAAWRGRRRPRV